MADASEIERWQLGGRYYAPTWETIRRGGELISMELTINDYGPAPARGIVLVASFVDGTDDAPTFRCLADAWLPFTLVERFVEEVGNRPLPRA